LYRQRGSAVLWLDYSIRGQRHRESSHSTSRREALDLLRQRIGDRRSGRLVANPDKVTLADLRQGLERHYAREGLRSVERAQQALAHVVAYFGAGAKALTLTRQAVSGYVEHRLGEGATRDTVRYEVGVLNTAFSVAVEDELLTVRPMFKRPPPGAARQGFFEAGGFAALLLELKDPTVRALVRFLHLTGWRSGEATGMTWGAAEWDDQAPEGAPAPVPGPSACIRLHTTETKGSDARAFPFAAATELRQLLLAQWKVRHGVCVFHRGGRPIKDFRAAWEAACTRAGLDGMLVHDLRRTAAREYRRQGVSEGAIMKLCGWKTRSMFDRYNIIDAADLSEAAAKRFTVKPEVVGTA
jgi:integrase